MDLTVSDQDYISVQFRYWPFSIKTGGLQEWSLMTDSDTALLSSYGVDIFCKDIESSLNNMMEKQWSLQEKNIHDMPCIFSGKMFLYWDMII